MVGNTRTVQVFARRDRAAFPTARTLTTEPLANTVRNGKILSRAIAWRTRLPPKRLPRAELAEEIMMPTTARYTVPKLASWKMVKLFRSCHSWHHGNGVSKAGAMA